MKTATKSPTKKAKKKAVKKVATKPRTKKKTIGDIWTPNQELTLGEELFCRYYILNEETRRNGTRSYDLAFDKNLDDQSRDDAVYAVIPSEVEGMPAQRKMIQPSSHSRCENVCAQGARQLLRKPQISKRITQLLNELMTDEFVDGELVKVISQDAELKPKVAAIGEYNKLKKRTTLQVEHHHSFAKYDNMTDDELEKALKEGDKFFKKK